MSSLYHFVLNVRNPNSLGKKMSKAGSENKFKIGQTLKLSMLEYQGRKGKLVLGRKLVEEVISDLDSIPSTMFRVLGDGVTPFPYSST